MIIDIIVLLVLLASALIAFLRGFIREVLTILGIVGGMAASYLLGPYFIPTVRGWLGVVEGEDPQKLFDIIPYPILADISAYAIILVVFVGVFSLLSHSLSEFAKNIGLGALDRSFGMIFGVGRGILLLGLLYLPFIYLFTPEQKERWFDGSKTYIYLESTSKWIASFITEKTEKDLQDKVGQMTDTATDTREKLEAIDLLQRDEKGNLTPPKIFNLNPSSENAGENTPENQEKPASQPANGYNEEFRDDMNELIEQENTPE